MQHSVLEHSVLERLVQHISQHSPLICLTHARHGLGLRYRPLHLPTLLPAHRAEPAHRSATLGTWFERGGCRADHSCTRVQNLMTEGFGV